MNRYKKERLKKGLPVVETAKEKELRLLHCYLFPEEYDIMYDSSWDARDRAKGICPMNAEYIDEANARRQTMGVSALSKAGLPVDNSSWDFCREKIEEKNR